MSLWELTSEVNKTRRIPILGRAQSCERRPKAPPQVDQLSDTRQCLIQICDDVLDILDADRKPDGVGSGTGRDLGLVRQLAVRRR